MVPPLRLDLPHTTSAGGVLVFHQLDSYGRDLFVAVDAKLLQARIKLGECRSGLIFRVCGRAVLVVVFVDLVACRFNLIHDAICACRWT